MDDRSTLDAGHHARFVEFLSRQGWIGEGVLAKDWSKTSIGPIETWPQALRAVLRFALTTRQSANFYWGPDLHQFFNEAYAPTLIGMPPDPIGAPFRTYWAEAYEGVRPYFERAMAGEGTWEEDLPLTLTRNGVTEQTYWTFSYSPLYDDDGSIRGFMNIVNETTRDVRTRTALEKAEAEQDLLNQELSHRMKNTLALVQAVARQTLRGVPDQAPVEAFEKRLYALSSAHDLLLRQSWTAAPVKDVVLAALQNLTQYERFEIAGPAVSLGPRSTLSLSLLIHELTTNAIKHGALSGEHGKVSLTWDADADRLVMRWRETGGPAAIEPARSGFGSRLIRMGLVGTGGVELRYLPTGFEADMEAPLHHLAES